MVFGKMDSAIGNLVLIHMSVELPQYLDQDSPTMQESCLTAKSFLNFPLEVWDQ